MIHDFRVFIIREGGAHKKLASLIGRRERGKTSQFSQEGNMEMSEITCHGTLIFVQSFIEMM
jgi:hypothetical protein